MSILDRFRQRAERIPREVVKEIVKHGDHVRKRNDEYFDAISDLLKRVDQRRDDTRRGVHNEEDN